MHGLAVNTIVKDSIGRMWLATHNGLMLYDGFDILPVKSIPRGIYKWLFYDANTNIITVGSTKGVWSVNCRTMEAQKMFTVSMADDVIAEIVHLPGENSFSVALHKGEIYQLSYRTRPSLLINTKVAIERMLYLQAGEKYLLADRKKIYSYKKSEDTVSPVSMVDNVVILSHGTWSYHDKMPADKVNPGLRILDMPDLLPRNGDLQDSIYVSDKLTLCATLVNGIAIVAYANHSIYLYDKENNSIENVFEKYSEFYYGKNFKCLFVDNNELWIGMDNGLLKLTCFSNKPVVKWLGGLIPSVSTRTILKDEQGIYIASYSGLLYKPTGGEWINLTRKFDEKDRYPYPYVMKDAGRYIYLGMERPFLYQLEKSTRSLKRIPVITDTQNKEKMMIHSLEYDAQGLLWMGTSLGIQSYDTATKEVKRYGHGVFDTEKDMVFRLLYDKKSRTMYAGTDSGFYAFSHTGRLKYHLSKKSNSQFASAIIKAVVKGPDRKLWLGTHGDGVFVLNTDGTIDEHFISTDGLADNIVYDIIFDDLGRAWICTHTGLSVYDLQAHKFYNYYSGDGLSINEFNHNSVFKDPATGTLYLGGMNGVNVINPADFRDTSAPFTIFISGIKKWNKEGEEEKIPYHGEASFRKDAFEYPLDIMLGSSDYTEPGKLVFLYKIDGITPGWVKVRDPNIIRSEGLPFGTHTVSVKAINYRGARSANELHFQLILTQPIYMRWWFIAIVLILVSATGYFISQYRIREMKKYQRLRIKIASDLHDEVGGLLTGIGMYSDNLTLRKELPAQARERARKIAMLSRQATSSMRDILWSIDARNDSLLSFEEQVRNIAEEILVPKNIRIEFDLDVKDKRADLPGDMRQQLYFFAKEAVNNIAKHSNATHVILSFIMDGAAFDFTIANDNSGETLPPLKENGQGLKNMKMRAKKLNAEFAAAVNGEQFIVRIRRK